MGKEAEAGTEIIACAGSPLKLIRAKDRATVGGSTACEEATGVQVAVAGDFEPLVATDGGRRGVRSVCEEQDRFHQLWIKSVKRWKISDRLRLLGRLLTSA